MERVGRTPGRGRGGPLPRQVVVLLTGVRGARTVVAAVADPVPDDGPCIFTGRTATWVGSDESFDDGAGHVLLRDMPMPVCDKTAENLATLKRPEIIVTQSTFHYRGGGCC